MLFKKRKGAAIVTVVGVFMVLAVIIVSMYTIYSRNYNTVFIQGEIRELYYLSKSGVEIAVAALYADNSKVMTGLLASNGILRDELDSKRIRGWPDDVKVKLEVSVVTSGKNKGMVKIVSTANKIKNASAKDEDKESAHLRPSDGLEYVEIYYVDTDGSKESYYEKNRDAID